MSSIPLAANNLRPMEQPPNALEQYARIQQIKGQQQTQQIQGQEIQKNQQALKDQQAHTAALNQWDGKDPDQLPQLILKNGGSGDAALAMRSSVLKQKQEKLTYDAQTFDLKQKQTDQMLGAFKALDSVPDEQLSQALVQKAQELTQQGLLDPQHGQVVQQMAQAGDPKKIRDALSLFEKGYMGEKEQFSQAQKERETAAQEQTARGREMQGQAALQKLAPISPGELQSTNKRFQDRYQQLNPGQPLPQEFTVQPGANRQAVEDIGSSLEKLENAADRRSQRQNQGGQRADLRSDRSYQYNSTQLEKVATPVDQAISRMSRLQDALAQNSPQADALIGPELLSVMAGGSGSGLRMNEAEISRVVGGRSKWETLKSSINQWQLDPSKATTITDEQRKEIRTLVSEVNSKLTAKQGILDDARQGLIGSDDPMQHRKIVADARTKMTQIDQGANAPGAQPSPPTKTLSMSQIQQAAKDHGVSVDEAKKQAQAAGYTIQ